MTFGGERVLDQDSEMPVLRIGRSVFEVSDAIRDAWGDLVAEARRDAAAHGHSAATLWYRTDGGATGLIRVRADPTVSFIDDGTDPDPDRGVIVAMAVELAGLGVAAEIPREETDEEIQARVLAMKADRPDLDWDNLLTGRLAGPVTPDRPDVPVWDYLTHAERHGIDVADLTSARFPVRFLEGVTEVTSVDEELKPPPANVARTLPRPVFAMSRESVIGRYAALHVAGVVEWDPIERGIVYLRPIGTWRHVLAVWSEQHAGTAQN